ncbi:DNA methyltransferase [Parasporobacterium paucivorans]|uniref:Methyltransferase n=1 Tax=Parasporobacterium paucivorans DSM 15970 TaxID=1122934 RepID=A0A1M6B5T1_9FIRM|nr:DNA methyltransferase [Parasporobacterium paucivorans]SHI43928.1 site-specific DNA-methyltransferase (adenine-specific) [Parasporobacterium paucivorans DSM 15970]
MRLPGFYNEDCMVGMAEFPDKYFDLAIVDPPYGININMNMGLKKGMTKKRKQKKWDNAIPSAEYFNELFRISKNQVIWGGNYFPLPTTRCFIVWDKGESMYGRSFTECEMAWTSFDESARIYKLNPMDINRFHPTQKPIKLYEWTLNKYAKLGDKILDTHVGSASSLIACHNLGFEFTGFELDGEYYYSAKNRLDMAMAQQDIFNYIDRPTIEEKLAYSE